MVYMSIERVERVEQDVESESQSLQVNSCMCVDVCVCKYIEIVEPCVWSGILSRLGTLEGS